MSILLCEYSYLKAIRETPHFASLGSASLQPTQSAASPQIFVVSRFRDLPYRKTNRETPQFTAHPIIFAVRRFSELQC